MSFESRAKELGLSLSDIPKPLGSYVPCVRSGNLLFLSGVLPLKEGKLTVTGIVGKDLSLEDAQSGARQVVVNAISVVRSFLGTLDRVEQCVKLSGFVASADDFFSQPAVLNAASDLLHEIFGEKGRHARAAIGVQVLPLNSPVEIDFIFEVRA
jgi:enamine deaminase RidA (YjgF/YER057c/UK114 family)